MDSLLNGGSSVFWFVVLFLPGFISVKVYGLIVATERPDFSKDFFEAVAFSILNFAVFLPFVFWFRTAGWLSDPWLFGLVVYVVMLVAPIGWPFLYIAACKKGWLPRSIQRKPWDDFFSARPLVWVVARMKSGNAIAGTYTGGVAAASSFPDAEQLLLSEAWELGADGKPKERVPRSAGVLFNMSEVESLEFYE